MNVVTTWSGGAPGGVVIVDFVDMEVTTSAGISSPFGQAPASGSPVSSSVLRPERMYGHPAATSAICVVAPGSVSWTRVSFCTPGPASAISNVTLDGCSPGFAAQGLV